MEQPAAALPRKAQNKKTPGPTRPFGDAGWSSPVARQAHNLKVVGSNPTPATNKGPPVETLGGLFVVLGPRSLAVSGRQAMRRRSGRHVGRNWACGSVRR